MKKYVLLTKLGCNIYAPVIIPCLLDIVLLYYLCNIKHKLFIHQVSFAVYHVIHYHKSR